MCGDIKIEKWFFNFNILERKKSYVNRRKLIKKVVKFFDLKQEKEREHYRIMLKYFENIFDTENFCLVISKF